MDFDEIKTKAEKAAGPVDDKAKEVAGDVKDKWDNMTGNRDDQSKGGDVNKSDQTRSDYSATDDMQGDINHANPGDPGYTGVDEEEYGSPGKATPASDLDDNPLDDEDRSYEE